MSPIKGPHLHQMLKNWIVPDVSEAGDPHLFADPDYETPKGIIIGKSLQGVIVPTILLKPMVSGSDNVMTHSLRNLALLG